MNRYIHLHAPHKVPGGVPHLCTRSCVTYVCSHSFTQQELQGLCAWVPLEGPSTHILLEFYHSSVWTFLDRQEDLQESKEVLPTLKA